MKKLKVNVLFFCILALSISGYTQKPENTQLPVSGLQLSEIPIRDPFILPVEREKNYYLYSATRGNLHGPNGRQGVCAYKSKDLKTWNGPYIVYENPEGFWAGSEHGIWAPEVHRYKQKYYLFATFTNPANTIEIRKDGIPVVLRGTQIMVSNSPLGPFKPFDLKKPHTPENWSALDGTLWIEDNKPYMIFCHEWVQINDGTFELAELKKDLSAVASKPVSLFKASDAAWVKRMDSLGIKYQGNNIPGFVSDGPFIHRLPSGKLICLTSSFGENNYALSFAVSSSGKLSGPWAHPKEPLLSGGHGHGMIFKSFDGDLLLACHFPNTSPSKTALYKIEEFTDGIRLVKTNP